MDLLRQQALEDLNTARERLLSIRRDVLTSDLISSWHQQWYQVFLRTRSRIGNVIEVRTKNLMNGFETVRDVAILDELRLRIVEILDQARTEIDSQVVVPSILEELILKIRDPKLATLLKEFNAVKDTNPNLAALGFRTILTLLIRERAKLEKPQSKLATKDDLGFEPDIKAALQEHIFSSAEEKLLQRHLTGGKKDTFDNVAHKPGANNLVNKDDLEDAVTLLNRLLPTII